MDEKEVRSIFVKELADKDSPEALMDSYNIMLARILEKFLGRLPSVDPQLPEIVKKITYAKSRLCFFLGIIPGSIVTINEDLAKELFSLYETWLAVLNYLNDNYDRFSDMEFKNLWTSKNISEVKVVVAEKYAKYKSQFAESKTLHISSQDFSIMEQTLVLTHRLILGKELFEQFLDEFNGALSILRTYQAQLFKSTDTVN
jgi:hypothetical protein